MEADNGPQRRPGGTVEPANRAAVAKQLHQAPLAAVAERYELRDPFAEVTYRANRFAEMTAKADQLAATKFFAVSEDGQRTPVVKVDGQWKRPDARVAQPKVKEAPEPKHADNVVPLTAPTAATESQVAKIDADAERAARVARLEAALFERYVIKRAPLKIGDMTLGQTEYRYRGDASRIAFTESNFRLATDNNNPSVARSMVDVAEARNWQALRVSGNEDFKRLVWLEASLRGVKTVGYEPQVTDQELLKRERESRAINRIEPTRVSERDDSTKNVPGAATKQSARGSGGRKAVLAALETILVAKGVPVKQRDAVMTAAAQNLAQRLREGQTLKVKVLDKSAPSQRTITTPTREVQRTPERTAPTR
jgi:Large polyvalent protein-associated domain 7